MAVKREMEAKCAVEDLRAVEGQLAHLGRQLQPWVFETNELWDFPDGRLKAAGCLLRLREVGETTLVTFKAPAPERAGVKSMDEAETVVASAPALRAILHGLGLRPGWRYEKFRSLWQVETPAGMAGICLDIVPCGQFIEVEGAPAAIAAAFAALGLTPGPEATQTYRDLFQAWLAAHNRPLEAPMVFTPQEAAAWRAHLNILPQHVPPTTRMTTDDGCHDSGTLC